VTATGVAGPRWAFEGFLPRSGRERRERLAAIAADARGTVLFEAPGRVAATLRDLAAACGPDRRAAVARELTKLHEQIVRASLGELADAVPDLAAARGRVDRLVAGGVARGEAARRVAADTGLPRRRLYGVSDDAD
jgi:16S rRNA (cytidine1402-2'-O)-methyltransferase